MTFGFVRKVLLLASLAVCAPQVSAKAEQNLNSTAPSSYNERLQRAAADELPMTIKRIMIEDQCRVATEGCNMFYRIPRVTIPYIRARFLSAEMPALPQSYLILSDALRIDYGFAMTLSACMRPPQYKCHVNMLPNQIPISGTGEAADDLGASSWLSAGSDRVPFVNLRSFDLDVGCLPIDTRLTAAGADLPGRRSMALKSLCRSAVLP